MVIDLEDLHAFELARADLLNERPLEPAKVRALARHIQRLAAADDAWIDRLAAKADAADAPASPRPSRSPHSGQRATPRRGDADPRHG